MHELPTKLPNELTENHDQTRWLSHVQPWQQARSLHVNVRAPVCWLECYWQLYRIEKTRLFHSFSILRCLP